MKRTVFYILIFGLLIMSNSSCSFWQNLFNNRDTVAKGIVFMIDDAYVEDFYQQNHYNFIQHNHIKMTYFICKYPHLSQRKKTIIKIFQNDGHEIGFHGTHHINAVNYLQNHTIDQYINYEILPGLKAMLNDGLEVIDFSYPYGAHTPELDSVLFHKYFYFIKLGAIHYNFYDRYLNRQIIRPFPLDRRYWVRYHLSLDKVLSFIDSADRKNKIIMLYGHGLSDTIDTVHNKIWFNDFTAIFNYAKSKGFKFYTLRDLQKHKSELPDIILSYSKELEIDLE